MKADSQNVVFITGAFLGNNCWSDFILQFERQGYNCIAPPWPFKDASPEELRNREPNDILSSNRLISLTDYFESIVKSLSGRPILIGHSIGGLIVQLLLQRGFGAAGIAIHSFPPSGVSCIQFSFFRVLWKAMAFFSSTKKTYLMPFNTWKYFIANGLSYELQKELYYQYAVPESKRIIRDVFNCTAVIDFSRSHVPLLFTSGSLDRLIPVELNFDNYRKYKINNSIVDFKEFSETRHSIFGLPEGTKEAEFILSWLSNLD